MIYKIENVKNESQMLENLDRKVVAFENADGDIFEEMWTMEQDLTFDHAEKAFARYGVEFSEDKYIALGQHHQCE